MLISAHGSAAWRGHATILGRIGRDQRSIMKQVDDTRQEQCRTYLDLTTASFPPPPSTMNGLLRSISMLNMLADCAG